MTALYRTYRPQRFADIVGQESVVRTLRNAVSTGKVAHAYLFTGPKGTGKTTMAKLLAKAMNCEHGPTPDPCGECESCIAIAEGRSIDVAEIDAASNRGIDDVREKIIDTVAFQPSMGTRRVYILDEAHQLTPSAFNALLKTIEEPPDHVLFAFCTTELHEMMPTVRDRCQRMVLAPPGVEQLVGVLHGVCEREGITADEAALRAIARTATGSFRNALGTLEMLSTAFGKEFTHADVLAHLGAVSEETLFAMADALLAGDAGTTLRIVEQLTQEGGDVEQFGRELAEHLRVVLLAMNGVDTSGFGISDTARLAAQAGAADERRLLAAIDCISDATTRIRVGTDPRLAMETALVRACQGLALPSLALRLATLEHKLGGGGGAVGQALPAPPAAASPAPAPAAVAVAPPATPTPAPAPAAAAPAPAAEPAGAPSADITNPDAWWTQLLSRAGSDASLRPMLQDLRLVDVSEHRILLASSRATMFTDKVRGKVQEHVKALTGATRAIEVEDTGAAAAEPAAAPAATTPPAQAAAKEQPASTTAAAPAEAEGGDGLALFQQAFDATELGD